MDPGDTPEYVAQTDIPGLYGTFSLQADGSYTYALNNALSAIQQLGTGQPGSARADHHEVIFRKMGHWQFPVGFSCSRGAAPYP